MAIEAFYKRYSKDTTTNFQLEKYAKEFKIANFYICMYNELSQLPRNKFPLNVIEKYSYIQSKRYSLEFTSYKQRQRLFL